MIESFRSHSSKLENVSIIYLEGTQIEARLSVGRRPNLLQCDDSFITKLQSHNFLILPTISARNRNALNVTIDLKYWMSEWLACHGAVASWKVSLMEALQILIFIFQWLLMTFCAGRGELFQWFARETLFYSGGYSKSDQFRVNGNIFNWNWKTKFVIRFMSLNSLITFFPWNVELMIEFSYFI